ncbi:MAG: MFS transporter [Thermoleophilia bacterium]
MTRRPSDRVILAVLVVAGLAYAVQQTMVIPALPRLQRDLDTTTDWTTWLLTGFLLSASVGTPLLGKLGDQHGKKRMLVLSLALFLVGCIGAAAAWDIWSLIVFRVLQGAAGAIFPLAFSIMRDEFPRERLPTAIGTMSAVFGIGGSGGLVIAGLIVDNTSWRLIFVVGAIPVVAALALVLRLVPESTNKTPSKLDLPGALLLSGGLVALLIALTEGESWGWGSGRVLGLLAAAAALLVAWVRVELRVPEPMVDMRMMANRPVLFTNLTAFIAGLAMYSSFVLLPNFMQTPRQFPDQFAQLADYGFRATATESGLYLAPGSLLMLVAAPLAGILGRRFGSKWPLAIGMVMIAIGAGLVSALNDAPWEIIVATVVLTPGVSLAFAAMSTLITQSVRPTETGVANAMNTVLRTVGGVVGAQVGAAILSAHRIGDSPVPDGGGYATAFAIFAGAAAIGAIVALLVTPRRSGPASLGVPAPSRA